MLLLGECGNIVGEERFILTNKNKIAIQDAEDKFTKEKKSVEASVLNERLSATEAATHLKALEDEKTSYILFKNIFFPFTTF